MTVRNRTLSEMTSNLVDLMIEIFPGVLTVDNTKVNIAPAAALNLIESYNTYCVITFIGEEEFTECIDRSRPAVKRNFSIFMGAHDSSRLQDMYDTLTSEASDGLMKLESSAKNYFECLKMQMGENPFIYYDADLAELVFRISVIN